MQDFFSIQSGGVKTNRDDVVYDFQRDALAKRIREFIDDYNAEVDRYKRAGKPGNVDDFVRYTRVNWSRDLKQDLVRGHYAKYEDSKIVESLYRPFTKRWLFLDRMLNEEVYRIPVIFPGDEPNVVINCTTEPQIEFSAVVANIIPCLHLGGRQGQCFPLSHLSDSARTLFRRRYDRSTLTKERIFEYIYGMLHHPGYRERYGPSVPTLMRQFSRS